MDALELDRALWPEVSGSPKCEVRGCTSDADPVAVAVTAYACAENFTDRA